MPPPHEDAFCLKRTSLFTSHLNPALHTIADIGIAPRALPGPEAEPRVERSRGGAAERPRRARAATPTDARRRGPDAWRWVPCVASRVPDLREPSYEPKVHKDPPRMAPRCTHALLYSSLPQPAQTTRLASVATGMPCT